MIVIKTSKTFLDLSICLSLKSEKKNRLFFEFFFYKSNDEINLLAAPYIVECYRKKKQH